MLEKSGVNYEDFAFKFKAHVTQQDAAAFADELEKPEKPDASTSATQFPRTRNVGDRHLLQRIVHARQGKGTRTMKNIASHNGLVARRQLCVRYNPYTKRKAITKLTARLRWEFGAESEFQVKLTEWASRSGKALRKSRCQTRSHQQCLPSKHQKRCLNTYASTHRDGVRAW